MMAITTHKRDEMSAAGSEGPFGVTTNAVDFSGISAAQSYGNALVLFSNTIPITSPTRGADALKAALREFQNACPNELFVVQNASGDSDDFVISWVPPWLLGHFIWQLMSSSYSATGQETWPIGPSSYLSW
jgi:hypothetical protein